MVEDDGEVLDHVTARFRAAHSDHVMVDPHLPGRTPNAQQSTDRQTGPIVFVAYASRVGTRRQGECRIDFPGGRGSRYDIDSHCCHNCCV